MADIVFISHGGGPLPLLGDPTHHELVETLNQIAGQIKKPKAIIVVSAHWEAAKVRVTHQQKPDLLYDYYGFPEESYRFKYACDGAPELAQRLVGKLQAADIGAELEDERGLDHGVFVPLMIMYPDADIPCIQLSLVKDLDAELHIKLGNIIADSVDENVLIIGSGFSFHNMRAFFTKEDLTHQQMNQFFEDWLMETCSSQNMTEEERRMRFQLWDEAPYARYCHPREEHLLPLHVCYGAARRACDSVYSLSILGKQASLYLWSSNI
jgi:4,5-DOPA dioxygenase extradiol